MTEPAALVCRWCDWSGPVERTLDVIDDPTKRRCMRCLRIFYDLPKQEPPPCPDKVKSSS